MFVLIFISIPDILIPVSSYATATLILEVDSGPYGSQLDNILNHAYKEGSTASPITTTSATTLRPICLQSFKKTFIIFFIIGQPPYWNYLG